jgi:RNA polymerase sigma factor FliA
MPPLSQPPPRSSRPPPAGRTSSWPQPAPNVPVVFREVPDVELARWTSLVNMTARRYIRRLPANVVLDDLVSAGRIVVWETLRRYPNVNAAYMSKRIRGAVVDELRRQDWIPRRMRDESKISQTSISHHGFDDLSSELQQTLFAHDPRGRLDARVALRQIAVGLEALEPRDRHILLATHFEGRSHQALAVELKLSEPRISQLHDRALVRLRQLLAEDPIGDKDVT